LLGVHSRYGLHTRAVTVYRDTLTEGFSHFVTSMTAPVASGWSGCRVGFAPTGKRRLCTAHASNRHHAPLTSRSPSKRALARATTDRDWPAILRIKKRSLKQSEAIMFERMTVEGRLLGFDTGDWSLLLGGFLLVGLLTLLV
jgi:hypothetical protein